MSYDMRDPAIMYFVGEGNVPQNSVTGQVYKQVAVGIIIDTKTSIIHDANVTIVSPLAIRFLKAQLIGKRLDKDFNQIIDSIDRYKGSSQKAILVAIKAILNKYLNFKYNYEQECCSKDFNSYETND